METANSACNLQNPINFCQENLSLCLLADLLQPGALRLNCHLLRFFRFRDLTKHPFPPTSPSAQVKFFKQSAWPEIGATLWVSSFLYSKAARDSFD